MEDAGVVRVLIQRRGDMSSNMDVKLEFEELSSLLPEATTLLNSEFLNGENISLSNREAVSRLFMEFLRMGSK